MKDLKISKELIKNVLAKETENLSDDFTFDIKDNYILFADEGECQFEVNIYEFAFKCKKWLLKNNIAFTLNYYNDNSVQFYCEKYHLDIESSSETETIIKSCKWIVELNNEK